jgi:hypothetical protein
MGKKSDVGPQHCEEKQTVFIVFSANDMQSSERVLLTLFLDLSRKNQRF